MSAAVVPADVMEVRGQNDSADQTCLSSSAASGQSSGDSVPDGVRLNGRTVARSAHISATVLRWPTIRPASTSWPRQHGVAALAAH